MQTKEYKELKNLVEQLAGFIAEKFSALEKGLAVKADKQDVSTILETLDAQSKYFQEHEMLSGQVNRHDRWIHKLAKQSGTELEY